MRVKERFVRGVNNFVFVIEKLEQREKKGSENWITVGYQVTIKGIKTNPVILENWPTNDELAHLVARYR